LEKVEKEKQ